MLKDTQLGHFQSGFEYKAWDSRPRTFSAGYKLLTLEQLQISFQNLLNDMSSDATKSK